MQWNFETMSDLFSDEKAGQMLLNGNWGLEKESLRVTDNGDLAQTPHPFAFNKEEDALNVTTDFSESQIELITPPLDSLEKTHANLERLQTKVETMIRDEFLWPLSMPGSLPDDGDIPIARYGNSDEARQKETYRKGLAHRYGKKMQMISGIHYNFSFDVSLWELLHQKMAPDSDLQSFINNGYFSISRNFLRYRWLLFYLFGASPLVEKGYKEEILKKLKMQKKNSSTFEKILDLSKFTTSLRMSRFGYENSLQNSFSISYNQLSQYIQDIRRILNTKSDIFSKIGLFKEGEQIQLNENLLQIENEYYSPIRFKQILKDGETQLDALEKRGIKYIEIRAIDLDPFEKVGIGLDQLYFMHTFLLFCLFEESGKISEKEKTLINSNAQKTAFYGRKKGLRLARSYEKTTELTTWSEEIFHKLRRIAQILDKNYSGSPFSKSIESQFLKLQNKSLLPSNRILHEMKSNQETYAEFGMRKARVNLNHSSKSKELAG